MCENRCRAAGSQLRPHTFFGQEQFIQLLQNPVTRPATRQYRGVASDNTIQRSHYLASRPARQQDVQLFDRELQPALPEHLLAEAVALGRMWFARPRHLHLRRALPRMILCPGIVRKNPVYAGTELPIFAARLRGTPDFDEESQLFYLGVGPHDGEPRTAEVFRYV